MSPNQDPVTVSAVHWRRILPVLHLFQAVSLGFRLRTLLPALLIVLGHFVALEIAQHFQIVDSQTPAAPRVPLPAISFPQNAAPDSATLRKLQKLVQEQAAAQVQVTGSSQTLVDLVPGPLPRPLLQIHNAVTGLLLGGIRFRTLATEFAFAVVPVLLLAVAVHRGSAFQFCRNERVGPIRSSACALAALRDTAVASGLTLLLAMLALAPLGLVAQFFGFPFIATSVGRLWPLFLLYGTFVYLFWTVLLAAWFLSLAAIATDECSGADALSRSISYLLSRKLQSAGYAWLLLLLAEMSQRFAEWLLQQAQAVLAARFVVTEESRSVELGIEAWRPLVALIPSIVQLSVLLSGISVAYVLLRHQVDGIELREVSGGKRPVRDSSAAASTHPA